MEAVLDAVVVDKFAVPKFKGEHKHSHQLKDGSHQIDTCNLRNNFE